MGKTICKISDKSLGAGKGLRVSAGLEIGDYLHAYIQANSFISQSIGYLATY